MPLFFPYDERYPEPEEKASFLPDCLLCAVLFIVVGAFLFAAILRWVIW